ncbi:hypothetical protein ACOME3_003347 [Neoechinorhynchus agilis]
MLVRPDLSSTDEDSNDRFLNEPPRSIIPVVSGEQSKLDVIGILERGQFRFVNKIEPKIKEILESDRHFKEQKYSRFRHGRMLHDTNCVRFFGSYFTFRRETHLTYLLRDRTDILVKGTKALHVSRIDAEQNEILKKYIPNPESVLSESSSEDLLELVQDNENGEITLALSETSSSSRRRVNFTSEQREYLNKKFKENPRPSQQEQQALATMLCVTECSVNDYFQNKRRMAKKR